MMTIRRCFAVASLSAVSAAVAQDSLCNPCYDPPVNFHERRIIGEPASGIRNTTVITAEEMRNLGIRSVADRVNRLPCWRTVQRNYGGSEWDVSGCVATNGSAVTELRIRAAEANPSSARFIVSITDRGYVLRPANPADTIGEAAYRDLAGLTGDDFAEISEALHELAD
jgi:hypothetical protein